MPLLVLSYQVQYPFHPFVWDLDMLIPVLDTYLLI
jgi:hypothetical protein